MFPFARTARLAITGLMTLVLAGCIGGDGDVGSALMPPKPALVRDPTVFVATTRMPVGSPIQAPWFSAQRAPDLIFAKANMRIPDRSMVARVTLSGDWDIKSVDDVVRKGAAQAFAQEALGRDVVLYVHGYKESFETATISAAQLSSGIGFSGITGLFTWPSAGSTFSYVSDRESAMWSRDAMQDLLTALANSPSGGRVHIVAHSMGTLLTLETLRMLRASGGESAMSRIGAVVLAAPDIDIDLFARGVEHLGADAQKITVISATNDRALAVSSRLAGGIVRAGAADRGRLEELGVKVADASDFGGGIINHDLFLSSKDVQQVVKRAIERGR
ncbi:alpha/beta hydrolase [Microvirga sp. 2MCAF38]|uniref:alpha/beta hydrolase n=1 Tax=Microvirga sp. 2MCAF38 TaxID=3232989 RepID=UPI003F9A00E9